MTSLMVRNSDHIRALVCGFPSPLRENRLLAMLVGYVDDSGSHENDYGFILAGFISTSNKWAQFSDEWAALCQEDPKTLNFKMRVAERLKGKNTYWGNGTDEELISRRDSKVHALALIIKKYAMCRISAGMDWKNYTEHVKGKGKVPPDYDSPYFFLFWKLLEEVALHQERTQVKEKVDFVFDDQGKIGDSAVAWRTRLLPFLSPFSQYILSSTPIFRHDDDVLPLKAADMLAWHMHRFLSDKHKDDRLRLALSVLLDIPCIQANITREDIFKMVYGADYY